MADLNEAFKSIKSTKPDPKFEKTNKRADYDFYCSVCNGYIYEHMSLQKKKPHTFVKSKQRREILPYEMYSFDDDGLPAVN